MDINIYYAAFVSLLIFLFGFFLGGYVEQQDKKERSKTDTAPVQSEPTALSRDIERVIVAAESRMRRRGDDGEEALL
jgi:hypothetical protein